MTFQGQPATWDTLLQQLPQVEDRPQTVLQVARTPDLADHSAYDAALGKAGALAKQFAFEDPQPGRREHARRYGAPDPS